MKPDWKDAPEWANWLAMDNNGDWLWFKYKPFFKYGAWKTKPFEIEYAKQDTHKFKNSLEQRPSDTK